MLLGCPIRCCTVGSMNSDLLSTTCLSLLVNTGFSCARTSHELLLVRGDWFGIKSLAVSGGAVDPSQKLAKILESRESCMGQGVSLQRGQTGQ